MALALSYLGKLADKVGQANAGAGLGSDGSLDGTFQLDLGVASNTITKIDLRRVAVGVWDTDAGTGNWVVGVATTVGGSLINAGDGSVSHAFTSGDTLYLFASDLGDYEFLPGSTFDVTVSFSSGPDATASFTIPTTRAAWKVGTITVPGGTGSQSITGLGGTPKAVFFFGTNWLTEDASDTASGRGLFRGMAAPKHDDPGTIVQSSATVTVPGDAHTMWQDAIRMLDTSGGASYLYGADLTSFDADGFTLNWFVATGGGYKVVYVALMDVDLCGAYVGASATLTLGWKAGASLLHGAWAGPLITGSDRSQEFYGGGAYPGAGGGSSWYGAGLSAFTFPTAPGSGQFNIDIYNLAPSTEITEDGSFVGPFLSTQIVTAYPTGAGLIDFLFSTNLSDNEGMVAVWNDDASQTGRLTPDDTAAGTVTVTGLPFRPGLLIGYSISNEPQGQSSGSARGAVGFSVVTPDFQWSALADGASSRGAYQSFQRGLIDAVDGSSVHAATIELTNDGFIVTTEEDDISAASWVWHAFGHRKVITGVISLSHLRVAQRYGDRVTVRGG